MGRYSNLTGFSYYPTSAMNDSNSIYRYRSNTIALGGWSPDTSTHTRTFVYSSIAGRTTFNSLKTLKIKEECDTVPFGCALCQSVEIEVQGSQAQDVKTLIENGNTVIKVIMNIGTTPNNIIAYTMGYFNVETYSFENNILKITGFDDMYKLQEYRLLNIPRTGAVLTPYDIIQTAVPNSFDVNTISSFKDTNIGITLAEMIVYSAIFQNWNTIDARNMLGYMVGKGGCFIKVDRNGLFQMCMPGGASTTSDGMNFVGTYGAFNYDDPLKIRCDIKIEKEKAYIRNCQTGFIMNNSNGDVFHGVTRLDDNNYSTSYDITFFDIPLSISADNTTHMVAIAKNRIGSTSIPELSLLEKGMYSTGEITVNTNPLWSVGQFIYFYRRQNNKVYRFLICSIEKDLIRGTMNVISREGNKDINDLTTLFQREVPNEGEEEEPIYWD